MGASAPPPSSSSRDDEHDADNPDAASAAPATAVREAPAQADAPRVADAHARPGARRVRRDLSARADDLRQLHQPSVPRQRSSRRSSSACENYRGPDRTTPIFRDSIVVTVKFTVITVAFEFVLGLIIALVVNSSFKGRGVMRATMLVPWAIPTVVSAQMWKWMYDDVFGVINDAAHPAAHHRRACRLDLARAARRSRPVAAVDIWKTTPFVALLLLAGLQVIPSDVYEAADVDGASKCAAVLADHAAAARARDPRRRSSSGRSTRCASSTSST